MLKISRKSMFFIILVGFVFCISQISDDDFVITNEIINEVNSDPNSTWTAGVNPIFAGKTFGEVKKMFGWLGHLDYPEYERKLPKLQLPKSFDAYEQWPHCKHVIRDQGDCGSCWAFSSTAALNDRFCIAGKNTNLSPQDLISCNTDEWACDGAYLSTEWKYFEETGVVSEKCFPYTSGKSGQVPKCPHKCEDEQKWEKIKHKTINGSSRHYKTVHAAMETIYLDGPIQTGFDVYNDFFSYKKGIYSHKHGAFNGGHAVKVQGWGVQDDEEYWIMANSFGSTWGMEGYFWIKKGVNECRVETDFYCALPKV